MTAPGPSAPADAQPARFAAGRAGAYDDTIARAIPGYGLLHDVAATLMAALLPESARVLVIGAGTGTDILRMGRDNPGWSFLGVDPSADMLAVARQRLAAAGPALARRVTLHEGTLGSLAGPDLAPILPAGSENDPGDGPGGGSESKSAPSVTRPVPPQGGFDAALCLLVTHFLPDSPTAEGKAALLAQAAGMLAPGAPLLLADFQTAEGAVLTADRRDRAWTLWQQERGIPDEAIARGLAHARRSIHPVSAARLAALLTGAGFEPPDPVFQVLHVHGWITRRGPGS